MYPPELLRHYYLMNSDYALYGDIDYHFRAMILSNLFIIEAVRDMEGNENDIRMKKYRKYAEPVQKFCTEPYCMLQCISSHTAGQHERKQRLVCV